MSSVVDLFLLDLNVILLKELPHGLFNTFNPDDLKALLVEETQVEGLPAEWDEDPGPVVIARLPGGLEEEVQVLLELFMDL